MSNDGGAGGTLNLFELSDSVPNAASVAVPALSIDIEFSSELRKIFNPINHGIFPSN